MEALGSVRSIFPIYLEAIAVEEATLLTDTNHITDKEPSDKSP
jgi:hypothetical protein